jgi:hypothetical protein
VVDVFEEVEGQLRSDRYKTLALKYLPWAGGGLLAGLVIALAVWGYSQYRQSGEEKASQSYASGIEFLSHGDKDNAYAKFQVAVSSSSAAYKSLGLMQQAAIRLDEKRTSDAVALFDAAAKAAPSPIIADAARLKAAYVLLDTAGYAELQTRLQPLIDAKRPYSAMAREALAMAKLNAGKFADARGDFVVLTLLPGATDAMRDRAHAALTLIDSGTASGIPATVKAALLLPPLPNPPPGAPSDAGGPTNQAPDQAPEGGAAQ